MNDDEVVSQAEVNNLLLHQKTEFRLQEVDKAMDRLHGILVDIRDHQGGYQRRMEDCKVRLKEEMEKDYVTKDEFTAFTVKMDKQWSKLQWTLSGAVMVILLGSWLLSQYSVVTKILDSNTAIIEQQVQKHLQAYKNG